MSFVSVAPDILSQTVGTVENFGSTLSVANTAAASATTAVAAPGR